MSLFSSEPIIACSTPSGQKAALAVIRLSGFDSLINFQNVFSCDLGKVTPRKAFLTDIISIDGFVIDESLITFFPAPYSFTGENILEISCHGNPLIIDSILNLFTKNFGFKVAGPGEFSYRALKNKKLSLAQVEGLDLILNADNSLAHQQGFDLLHGPLFKKYLEVRDLFLKFKSYLELNIDFSEDVGVEEGEALLKNSFKELFTNVSELNSRVQNKKGSLLSLSVVLFGKTNAGKSSLFNELLREHRSIVSDEAGTTRDYVSENLVINEKHFRLIDTAGIRDTSSKVEQIGIDRAKELIDDAFFKVLVVNPFLGAISAEMGGKDFDLVVFTHFDQEGFDEAYKKIKVPQCKHLAFVSLGDGPIEPAIIAPIGPGKSGPIEPKKSAPIGPNSSAPVGPGINGPIEPIFELISSKYLKLSKISPIIVPRHQDCISRIYAKVTEIQGLIDDCPDIGIISSEISVLGSILEELVGIVSADDVLDSIFSNFCIGK